MPGKEKMMPEETEKIFRGQVSIFELDMFDPSIYEVSEETKKLWATKIKIPIGRFLCDGQLWQKGKDNPACQLELSKDKNRFAPKDEIFLTYQLDYGDEPSGNRSVWIDAQKNKSIFNQLPLCSDYVWLKEKMADITFGVLLGFLNSQNPDSVGDLETYAFPIMECSEELAKTINSKRVVGAGQIAIARFKPKKGLTSNESILLAAGTNFKHMEEIFKKGIRQLDNLIEYDIGRFHH